MHEDQLKWFHYEEMVLAIGLLNAFTIVQFSTPWSTYHHIMLPLIF
jgi:hypothetical protein